MTTAHATRQDVVLKAIVARIREKIPELSDHRACFFCDQPFPLKAPGAEVFCTIAAADGQFDERTFAGGGAETLTESTAVDITVIRRAVMDTVGRATEGMMGEERGLIAYFKPRILKTLLKDNWEPKDNLGYLLRDQMMPISSRGPRIWEPEGQDTYLFLTLTFRTNFDWDLG